MAASGFGRKSDGHLAAGVALELTPGNENETLTRECGAAETRLKLEEEETALLAQVGEELQSAREVLGESNVREARTHLKKVRPWLSPCVAMRIRVIIGSGLSV